MTDTHTHAREEKKLSHRVRLIEVCDQCFRAGCWHGEDMCDGSRSAGLVLKTASELRKIGAEAPWVYSLENVERVCGSSIFRDP